MDIETVATSLNLMRSPTRIILAMLIGVIITFPVACWGPDWVYRPAMCALMVCCWGPAIVLRWVSR